MSDFTGTLGASLYLVGTMVGSTFLPAETYLTCTQPTEEDGLTYMLLGLMTSAYAMNLFPEHPLYRFVDGTFQPLSQVAYQAYAEVGMLRTETQTAIEQTNAAIALKADQTAMDAMSVRMDSAELKLQPDQLMSSIRSSSLYRYDRYGGRNYVLNSSGPYSFEGGYYKYPSGTVSTYTGLQLTVSDDLFEHSGNGATLRLSFDIKRTDIDAAAASTAGVYFGVWVYYRYYGGTDGTTLYSSGRGYYLRTTDSDFVATDDDWVHITKGPMSIVSYDPIGIAYVSIGTGSAVGSTGSLQIRNVKCEVGDSFTDWSAAPEDLNDLPDRMTTAESSISQHSSQIALKVSTSTYNAEKVYRGSTAPTTLYTNMLWLDTSVTPNLLKRYTGSAWVVAGAEEVKSSGIYIGPNQVSIKSLCWRCSAEMAENKKTVDETAPETAENADKQHKRITHSQIDNTLYIVESVQSSSASETVCNKLKRLILNNAARA